MSYGLTDRTIPQLAARQLRDYDAGSPGNLLQWGIDLSMEQAYVLQRDWARLRELRGEACIGYKVGCTSRTIQEQLGINEPIFGRLFEGEQHSSGVALSAGRYANLGIEGELAVRLGPGAAADSWWSEDVVEQAIDTVFAVIELHHYVFRGPGRSAAELIAINGMHAGFIQTAMGSPFRKEPAADLAVLCNGAVLDECRGAELTGGVIRSLKWLAEALREYGLRLEPGQIVLTGSPTRLVPVSAGSTVEVRTSHWGVVEAQIED